MKQNITEIKKKYISLGIKNLKTFTLLQILEKIIGKEYLNVEIIKSHLKPLNKLLVRKEQ